MITPETIIAQTQKWIMDVVIGCNFCPFAAKEVKKKTVYYKVEESTEKKNVLTALSFLFTQMDENELIETAFLIIPNGVKDFKHYLQLSDLVNKFIEKENYEGIYQVATFHPEYLFAGATTNDAANYTNRSPYPMLHVLRESSLTKAIDNYPNVDSIPKNNIAFATSKGLDYMKLLRQSCFEV